MRSERANAKRGKGYVEKEKVKMKKKKERATREERRRESENKRIGKDKREREGGSKDEIEERNEEKSKKRGTVAPGERKRAGKVGEGGEKGRWMIGYPSHLRPHSTNIRVGGIYSYKLSAGVS